MPRVDYSVDCAVQYRVQALARWESRIARALARGDLNLAAIVAHELGLLGDGQLDRAGAHRV